MSNRSTNIFSQHWLKDKTGKGKGRDDSPANAALEKQLKLQESFVVVPPGDEGKTVTCSVCAESLHSEFKEDDEDWVWKNAVSVNGKIFHATCYADAASGAVVAKSILANIKKANRLRSRSATPEVKSERPLTPLNPSSKRKASGPDGPDSTLLEPEGTPPSKRSLLSV
jgi:pre-mRNA cleavage complex 2 protein Pcf11